MEDLKNNMALYKKLINNGMIMGSVGYDKEAQVNYVLLKINENMHTAELRLRDDGNGGLRYSIYPTEKDYIEDTPKFGCVGRYDKASDNAIVEGMKFATSFGNQAGFRLDEETNKNVVWSTTSTGSYIPAPTRLELMAEYMSKVGDKKSFNEFLDQHAELAKENPIVLNQEHHFEEDPLSFVSNLDDGYKIIEDIMYKNLSFSTYAVDQYEHVPTTIGASNGNQLCSSMGLNSVTSEIWVTRNSIISNTPLHVPYDSTVVSTVKENKDNNTPTVTSYVQDLNVKYFSEGKHVHYDILHPVPEVYDIDETGKIVGIADIAPEVKADMLEEIALLNKKIVETGFEIAVGVDPSQITNYPDDVDDDMDDDYPYDDNENEM